MKKRVIVIGTSILLVGGFILSFALLTQVVGRKTLEHLTRSEIEGHWTYSWIQPQSRVGSLQLKWREHLEIQDGQARIHYWLIPNKKRMRIRIFGNHLKIHFLGRWARQAGAEYVNLDTATADFEVSKDGIVDIHQLEAHGNEYQFQFREK